MKKTKRRNRKNKRTCKRRYKGGRQKNAEIFIYGSPLNEQNDTIHKQNKKENKVPRLYRALVKVYDTATIGRDDNDLMSSIVRETNDIDEALALSLYSKNVNRTPIDMTKVSNIEEYNKEHEKQILESYPNPKYKKLIVVDGI